MIAPVNEHDDNPRLPQYVAAICYALSLVVALLIAATAARGQTLAECPPIGVPCASYSWEDALHAAAGAQRLREYLRILGHVSLNWDYYDGESRILARCDAIAPGLPVCLCVSPYGPAREPLGWIDPVTKTNYDHRPVWAVDSYTISATSDHGTLLKKWSQRLQGREVTILVDFERWKLDGDTDPRSPGALGDRWRALMGQIDTSFPARKRLIVYGWGDQWFSATTNTSARLCGDWRATQYWPSDLSLPSVLAPVCYYGATPRGLAWQALRLDHTRAVNAAGELWPHVALVGEWPVSGSWRYVEQPADGCYALGALLRANDARPVFWGRVGSPEFDRALPHFVRGVNGD